MQEAISENLQLETFRQDVLNSLIQKLILVRVIIYLILLLMQLVIILIQNWQKSVVVEIQRFKSG